MPFVLDACALIAFLRKEPGAEVVRAVLTGRDLCMAHAVNVCEMYYDFIRAESEAAARAAIRAVESTGVIVREDLDAPLWQQAARYKARPRRISLADCFLLALAHREGAEVVTSDPQEFDPVVERGFCPVTFIR